jgi:hypothetical protein
LVLSSKNVEALLIALYFDREAGAVAFGIADELAVSRTSNHGQISLLQSMRLDEFCGQWSALSQKLRHCV